MIKKFVVLVGFLWIPLSYGTNVAPAVIVETIQVKVTSLQQELTAIGTLVSLPGIIVRPEIPGRVVNVYFKSGDVVKAGTPLVELNSEIIKAQLAEYRATLNLSKLAFERAVKLYKTRTVSKADYDQAQANLLAAQARVDAANAQLSQTKIVAPFGGRLGLTAVSVGDFLAAGQHIVTLNSLDPINVDFSIPELYLSQATVGQTVQIRSDAYVKENFVGRVDAIESLINASNRTLRIRASLPNKDGKLLPGAFVTVKLLTGVKAQVILIPQVAVIYAANGNYVYKVVNGKAIKTNVVLGAKDANNVIVKSGLAVGDIIVTAGQLKIQDGSLVTMK